MSEIKKIYFKNYKGFEQGFLEFRRLNVLVGANSSGKSSLIKLLLLLGQSLSSKRRRLFLYKGPLVDIGEKKNLYRGHLDAQHMEFKFEFLNPISMHALVAPCIRAARPVLRQHVYALSNSGYIGEELLRAKISLNTSLSLTNLTRGPITHEIIETFIDICRFVRASHGYLNNAPDSELSEQENANPINYDSLLSALQICKSILSTEVTSITYTVRHNPDIGEAEIVRTQLHKDELLVFQLKLRSNKNLGKRVILSGFDQRTLERHYSKIVDAIQTRSFKFSEKKTIDFQSPYQMFLQNPVGTIFAKILSRASSVVEQTFNIDKIRHISPLRAYPKRYYLVDGSDDFDNFESVDRTADESERIIKLLKKDPSLIPSVNTWLTHLGHHIDLQQIQDSIYKILISDENLVTDLTNVGFGLSQILPVIIEPLIAKEGDIVIIQQPEIHLHPKAQALLGDFFVAIAKAKKVWIFIETHSEYMLRRLRRRSTEGSREPVTLESLPPDYLSVLSVERKDKLCRVNELTVGEDGSFQWPKDFLEAEIDDLIAYLDVTAKAPEPRLASSKEMY